MLDPADQVNAGALLGVLSDAAIMDTDPHFFRRGLEVVMPEDEVVVISEDSSNEVLARSQFPSLPPVYVANAVTGERLLESFHSYHEQEKQPQSYSPL